MIEWMKLNYGLKQDKMRSLALVGSLPRRITTLNLKPVRSKASNCMSETKTPTFY